MSSSSKPAPANVPAYQPGSLSSLFGLPATDSAPAPPKGDKKRLSSHPALVVPLAFSSSVPLAPPRDFSSQPSQFADAAAARKKDAVKEGEKFIDDKSGQIKTKGGKKRARLAAAAAVAAAAGIAS